MDFLTLLDSQAAKYPKKPAIIFRDMPITFAQFKESSLQVANGLIGFGIKKDDKVAILLPNTPEYAYSFMGVFFVRAVAVPLDFMLTEEEVVNFINHSDSKVLITFEKKGIDLSQVKAKCPKLKKIVLVGESAHKELCVPWQEFLQEQKTFPRNEIRDTDHAALFYTSGSTGHPKGVLLNYGHLKNPIDCFAHFLSLSENDTLMCAGIPFSHLGGLDHLLLSLYFGVSLVLMERFQPYDFLKNLEKFKVTIFCIVPSMYVAALSLKEFEKYNLSSLRYAVVFGAPSAPALLARFHAQCPGAYLLNGWGMTETAAPNAYLPTGTNTKEIPGTGTFQPGLEAKIVDDQGGERKGAQDGELLLRGKAIMECYYKEPQLTAEVLGQDGWFRTGDVVHRDEKGRYSIVGRKKEMIKVSGEIVFCPEVEEVIHRHEKVAEVAVIGVADAMRGEVPKAFIVLKEGMAQDVEELRFFLRQHMAHFKIPHHFEFVNELPKNRVGKIDKERLKQLSAS